MRLHVLLGILILNIAAFTAGKQSKEAASVAKIIEGVAQFSGKFVQQVAKTDRKNFVVSPLGAYLALTNPSFGARRHTEDVFNEALGLTDATSDTKRIGVDFINRFLESFNESELRVMNAMFVPADIDLHPDFIETVTRVGHSRVQKIHYMEPDQHELIVLTSTVYFNGISMKQLEPVASSKMKINEISFTFENGSSTESITFLRGLHMVKVGVCPETNAQFVEIPYKADTTYHNMSMFIIYPSSDESLVHLEENFDKLSVKKLYELGEISMHQIILPKFKIDRTLKLKDSLKRMGLDHIFKATDIDFSGIFSPDSLRSLYNIFSNPAIHEFRQTASVELDGRGVNNWAHFDEGYFPWLRVMKPFYVIIATTGPIPLNILTARFTGEE